MNPMKNKILFAVLLSISFSGTADVWNPINGVEKKTELQDHYGTSQPNGNDLGPGFHLQYKYIPEMIRMGLLCTSGKARRK